MAIDLQAATVEELLAEQRRLTQLRLETLAQARQVAAELERRRQPVAMPPEGVQAVFG